MQVCSNLNGVWLMVSLHFLVLPVRIYRFGKLSYTFGELFLGILQMMGKGVNAERLGRSFTEVDYVVLGVI